MEGIGQSSMMACGRSRHHLRPVVSDNGFDDRMKERWLNKDWMAIGGYIMASLVMDSFLVMRGRSSASSLATKWLE